MFCPGLIDWKAWIVENSTFFLIVSQYLNIVAMVFVTQPDITPTNM
jgi:hypothetical protein